jgi:hypothetical protein
MPTPDPATPKPCPFCGLAPKYEKPIRMYKLRHRKDCWIAAVGIYVLPEDIEQWNHREEPSK